MFLQKKLSFTKGHLFVFFAGPLFSFCRGRRPRRLAIDMSIYLYFSQTCHPQRGSNGAWSCSESWQKSSTLLSFYKKLKLQLSEK